MASCHRALYLTLLFAVPVGLITMHGGAPSPAWAEETASLDSKLDRVFADAKLGAKAHVSAMAIDLGTGKAAYTKGEDCALAPASNMKLLTTAAALCELGEHFELTTDFLRRGSMSDGVLNGDVLLVGHGDPNISGRFHDGDITFVLKKFAKALFDKGVRRVSGNLYYDDSYFTGDRFHPDWPKEQYLKWYTAEVSALTVNDSCLTITVDPTKPGQKAKVRALPKASATALENDAKCIAGKGDPKIGWSRSRDGNDLRVWGTVSSGRDAYTGECTVNDPARFCAAVMRETLEAQGISVDGKLERMAVNAQEREKEWTRVANHASGLAETIFVCNTNSQNLYAECLLRIVGVQKANDGSFTGGAGAVKAFLKRNGIPVQGLDMRDGSGLAPTNRVTAQTITRLLAFMSKRDDAAVFKSSLAVAGETGTLAKRLTGSSTKGRVFAKTGYIDDVNALSGYVDARSGKRYAFSVIVNDGKNARRVLDDFARALADS